MSFGSIVAEYLKLARSFNMALTGVAPVLAALAMGETNLLRLVMFFLVGVGAHIYGFVLNDYMDMRIDKLSTELSQRPLLSGTVTPNKALGFALGGLTMMLVFGYLLVYGHPRVVVVLIIAAVLATIYNLISKHLPGMDIFVAGAVLFLCIFGAAAVAGDPMDISRFGWIVCSLGGLQVMFMNIVAGGLKDIDHDSRGGGNTLAVALGCKVKGKKDKLTITAAFRALAYLIQLIFLLFLFSPFLMGLFAVNALYPLLLVVILALISAVMIWASYKIMNQPTFVRGEMRKYIGIHYMLNYLLTPIMMSAYNPWILLTTLVFPVGFLLSNRILAGEALKAKTM